MRPHTRLRNLDATGWALLVAGVAAVAWASSLAVGVPVAASGSLAGTVAYAAFGVGALLVVAHIARPEVAGDCGHCGATVRVDSGDETADMALTIPRAGAPDRTGVGPVSVIRDRDYEQAVACSPTCAQAIWDRHPTPVHRATAVDNATDRSWPGEDGVVTDGGDGDDVEDADVVEVIE